MRPATKGVFRFGTKAETLAGLASRLQTAEVLPLAFFSVGEWRDDPAGVLDHLEAQDWSASPLVVRSSSRAEDQDGRSNAGRFLSLLDVRGPEDLRRSIDAVVDSYDEPADDDQILVQPELRETVASGVAFSCDPSTGGPYRVVNWQEGSDTTAVTAGRDGTSTWYCLAYEPCPPPNARLAGLQDLMNELQSLLGTDAFECEFGVRADGRLVLFQTRPLPYRRGRIGCPRHRDAVRTAQRQLAAATRPHPQGLGSEAVFGVMPDWNPAEMIGLRPRPLAMSLYRNLITDRAWAEARHRYGYRDLRRSPLMISFCGLPYIDVRASVTSLVPARLGQDAAGRLVRHYLDTLRAKPHLHDKIELEVVHSAYHFTVAKSITELVAEDVLSREEADTLLAALQQITLNMIGADGPVQHDLRVIQSLAGRPLTGRRNSPYDPGRLAGLLDLCRREGTAPFAGLARAAFVAVRLVDSLVECGVLSPEDRAALLGGANEVTATLRRDFWALDRAAFLQRYGFLRPSSYDILSPRYDESPSSYFDWSSGPADTVAAADPRFEASPAQRRALDSLLAAEGLPVQPAQLLDFVTTSVFAREWAKLQFSRVLSESLVEIRRLGEQLGFDAADMSYSSADVLLSLTGDRQRDRQTLASCVERGRQAHEVTETLSAPALLQAPGELRSFCALADEPNFITSARVAAPVADVTAGERVDGAVAMIPSADPGYDWIFTHPVARLITAFGGANSHMAIRSLELGLPAVIGAGERRFRQWMSAGYVEIDGAARLVRPVPAGVVHSPAASADGSREVA